MGNGEEINSIVLCVGLLSLCIINLSVIVSNDVVSTYLLPPDSSRCSFVFLTLLSAYIWMTCTKLIFYNRSLMAAVHVCTARLTMGALFFEWLGEGLPEEQLLPIDQALSSNPLSMVSSLSLTELVKLTTFCNMLAWELSWVRLCSQPPDLSHDESFEFYLKHYGWSYTN